MTFFSSDLLRAYETCEIIASKFNKQVIKSAELREMSFGDAEGKPQDWSKVNIVPPGNSGNRLDHQVFPNSETRRQVGLRVQTKLDDIINASTPSVVWFRLVLFDHGLAQNASG